MYVSTCSLLLTAAVWDPILAHPNSLFWAFIHYKYFMHILTAICMGNVG